MPSRDTPPAPPPAGMPGLEAILASVPDVAFVLDSGLRLLRWNPALERLSGREPVGLDGVRFLELVRAADRDHFLKAVQTLHDLEYATLELRLIDAEGAEHPYAFNLTVLPGAGSARWTIGGIGRDISEQEALERRLRELTAIDALTRVYNRREVESRLHAEVARADRYGGDVCLLLLDIDHFKAVNDRLGHQAGDRVLQALARSVREHIRASDHLGRWAGEEFMVVAPEMDLSEATGFAIKLRHAIGDADFGAAGTVTASFGVACYRGGERVEALIKRADDALRRAKAGGRDRVESEVHD